MCATFSTGTSSAWKQVQTPDTRSRLIGKKKREHVQHTDGEKKKMFTEENHAYGGENDNPTVTLLVPKKGSHSVI